MGEPDVVEEACPTQGGVFSAYLPQFLQDGEWKTLQTRRSVSGEVGMPFPLYCGGVCEAIGLCGLEQANAFAWAFAAHEAAQGRVVKVRAKEYRVHYDIKAYAVKEASHD